MDKSELHAKLAAAGQEHVLAFWEELNPADRASLGGQLAELDLELLARLHRGDARPIDWADLARRAEPPPAFRLGDAANHISAMAAQTAGRQALAAGEVGAVLVAGGQGSRLGFEHPKGMYPVGPVSRASLFQILLEKILGRARRAGRPIPLYIMTSPATDAETRSYLAEHGYFGLPAADVHIFCQGTMPAVCAKSGRLLLAEKHRLSLSPDGHGGCLAALARSGALADMRRRGIKLLFYFQVDNPLAPVCDPEFLGYHLLSGAEMSTLVVRKQTSRDKVGNVGSIDGRLHVLEYSDFNPLSDELVDRKAAGGEPVFWAGSIAVHVFNVDFLERESARAEALPFHVAHKAVPHLHPTGEREQPKEPNAFKFERFIFDLMPLARHAIVIEGAEDAVFSPLKNAPGEAKDTPQTVERDLIQQARRWLRAAGVEVDEQTPVEISPLVAQDEVEARENIPAETHIDGPRYFDDPHRDSSN